jgi:cell division transport system permease protein
MTGRFRLLVSEAWRSLGANLSTTVAATLTVLIGMFLLGVFIAFGTWTRSWSDHVKKELVVKVFFKQSATRPQESAVARMLNQSSLVKPGGVKFVSRQQGWAEMKRRYPQMVADAPANPLGDRLDVTPARGEEIDALYDSIVKGGKPPGVDTVTDAKQTSHRILKVAHAIDVVFILATLILLVASVLLISNTIRLSIFSRRRESEVMKLVGATNWFVRGPFMVEGLFTGLIGSLLAIFFLVLGKAVALPAILPHLSSDPDVKAMTFPLMSMILVAIGLGLGVLGSGVTIRRFLQV